MLTGRSIDDHDEGRLAEKAFWDTLWARGKRHHYPRRGWYPDDRFIQLFSSISWSFRSRKVLEVGCAGSVWLAYFAREHGAEVYGIDYSEVGCGLAKEILRANKVSGHILCRDLFDENDDLLERFDVVLSFGLVEHFSNVSAAIMAKSRFLRPSGLIITVVPNMRGLMGWAQRLADPAVYQKHNMLTPEMLEAAHAEAGMATLRYQYFGSYDPAVVNEGELGRLPNFFLRSARVVTRSLAWPVLRLLPAAPESWLISPYVLYVGRKAGRLGFTTK